MKLTDEKILEIWRAIAGTPNDHGLYYDCNIRFARAILKEAGVEELERDAERLVWSMHHMPLPSNQQAFFSHVMSVGGVGDLADCRTFIDKQK